jgi:hypothetical protein
MKTCSTCKVTKPYSEFHKSSSEKDGYKYQCKECRNSNSRKKYHQKDKDEIRNRKKPYIESHKAEMKETQHRWYLRNKDKVKKQSDSWSKNNPSRRIAKNAKRHASKLGATPSWLTEDHKTFMKIQYQMANLLSNLMGEKYHVDHIHPLRGEGSCGLHVPWNMQVIPAADNIRKSNKLPLEAANV